MANERITEAFVRDWFKNDPLFSAIKLDEQKTSVAKARKCLADASKKMTGKGGSPEFIISFPSLPDDIIVVECKADAKFHASASGDNPIGFAVDGARHYSKFLSQEFNVVSIAVSGDTKTKLKISSFYQKRGTSDVQEINGNEGTPKLLDIFSYIEFFNGPTHALNIESAEITKTAIELNKELNDYSIVEYERCTLVSAILLALHDPPPLNGSILKYGFCHEGGPRNGWQETQARRDRYEASAGRSSAWPRGGDGRCRSPDRRVRVDVLPMAQRVWRHGS